MTKGKYYEVVTAGADWALNSPAGLRVKLYTVGKYGTSHAAFAAATKEALKRNLKIDQDKK
jgi:hypothetical protein